MIAMPRKIFFRKLYFEIALAKNNKNAITNDEIKSQTTDKILIDFQFEINCLYFML